MPVRAITISRQLGSLGSLIAQMVAQRLGYRMVWRELINQAARRACVPEVALATIDDLGLLGIRPSSQARAAYQRAVRQVMEELVAEGGVVIVGRAGQVILRGHPDVLHVQVVAPAAVRAERLARRQNISIEAALAQVTASDRTRRNYLRRYYHARWDDPLLYDVVVNTERLTPAAATELICLAAMQPQRRPGLDLSEEPEPDLE